MGNSGLPEIKMRDLDPSREWSREDMVQMLALLPELEAPGFEPCTWCVPPGTLGFPEYHPTIERWRNMVYGTSCAIDPYCTLPEDAPDLDPNRRAVVPLEFFETATLNQVRRYLALIVRGERFCDGCIEDQYKSGRLIAAIKRAGQIAGL